MRLVRTKEDYLASILNSLEAGCNLNIIQREGAFLFKLRRIVDEKLLYFMFELDACMFLQHLKQHPVEL